MARLPAGVSKRKGGTKLQKRFTVDGKRYSIYGNTITELEEKEREKRKQIAQGIYKNNKVLTLEQLFNEWVNDKAGSVKPSSLALYKKIYKSHLSPLLGHCKVMKIERRQAVRAIQTIAKEKGIYTANRSRGILRMLFKYAMFNEIVDRNIIESIPTIRDNQNNLIPARETIHRELSEEEIKVFFSYCKNSIYYNLMRCLLHTGMRAGEGLALQWLDIKNNKIYIRRTITQTEKGNVVSNSPKTQKSKREIPMNDYIKMIIREQWEIYKSTHKNICMTDFVFPNEKGSYGTVSVLNTIIMQTIKRMRTNGIQIKHFSSHAFRDTFASRASRNGVPPNVLKEILGHTNFSITMNLYAHISENDKIIAMKGMSTNIQEEQTL